MDRTNRKELLDTIDRQKEELDRYKGRLRDLAVAYRSLVKEKEALEASVKALSTASSQESSALDEASKGDGNTPAEGGEGGGEGETTAEGREAAQLRQQIATLTLSIATLAEQKTKMETSYQDDKRKMRQEQSEALQKLNEEKENLQTIAEQLTEQLAEFKARLRTQQQEREADNLNHAAMMRELQSLVGRERNEKEKMENKIFDLEDTIMKLKSTPDKSVEYVSHIKRLSEELGLVKTQLTAAEEASQRPSPILLQLQNDMAEMKAQHRIQIETEQRKARETEERLQRIRAVEEQRVADLESKLSALSETVGSYDRDRQHDQTAIQRLKERITQLDLENTALARAANKSSVIPEDLIDSESSVADIRERIMKLKGLLKLASQKAEKPVDIDELCNIDDESSRETDVSHSACQQELKRLKEEFEAYKTRASNVLKNRTAKDTTHNKELEQLQNQLAEMRERVSALRQQLDDEEGRHRQSVEDFQHRVAQMKDKHKAALLHAENEYKLKAGDLDQQMQRQRERTVALLTDKDLVIDDLKSQLSSLHTAAPHPPAPPPGQSDQYGSGDDTRSVTSEDCISSEAEETVSQLVASPSTPGGTGSSFLHFAEELARREVELGAARRQRQQSELALRQLQDKHATTMQAAQERLDTLGEEVDRWKRNRSREGTNMEYLKNVVLSYLQSDSYSTKKQMFNAIAAILQFTGKERENVLKKLGATWWGPS